MQLHYTFLWLLQRETFADRDEVTVFAEKTCRKLEPIIGGYGMPKYRRKKLLRVALKDEIREP